MPFAFMDQIPDILNVKTDAYLLVEMVIKGYRIYCGLVPRWPLFVVLLMRRKWRDRQCQFVCMPYDRSVFSMPFEYKKRRVRFLLRLDRLWCYSAGIQ